MVRAILPGLLTASVGLAVCGPVHAAPSCAVTYLVTSNSSSFPNATFPDGGDFCVLAGDKLYGGFWNIDLLPSDGEITFIESANEIVFVDDFIPGSAYTFGYDVQFEGDEGIAQFDANFTQFSGGPSLLTANAYNEWDRFFGVMDVSTNSRLSIDDSALDYSAAHELDIHETLVVNNAVDDAATNTFLDGSQVTPTGGGTFGATPIPEPGALALYAVGLAGLGLVRRFHARRQCPAFSTLATSTEK